MPTKLPPDKADRLPALVIVGRPNVGKSALFNRLVGRRAAIVHEESGVTRDRLAAAAEWNGRRFTVMDTGGLVHLEKGARQDPINAGIREQAEAALAEADVVLMVTDAETGLHPLDRAVAARLRRAGRPVLVAANKCDTAARDEDASDFLALGFPVFPVSALHARGFDELMEEALRHFPARSATPTAPALRIAIVGRPNVGKSSFVNRLLRCDRVLVSDRPGTTRDSVDIPFSTGRGRGARHYLLTDTAGLRRPAKVDSAVERFSVFRAERSIAEADVVLLLLDAAQGPTEQDKKIAAMVLEHRKGCALVVNKWDLLAGHTQTRYLEALHETLPFLRFAPVVFVSALTGYNVRRSLDAIEQVAAQIDRHIATGPLNRTIEQAVLATPPPAIRGKRLKIYYATQTGTRPVRIALFVNDPQRLAATYREYLIHELRRQFGLEGAPIVVTARHHGHKASFREKKEEEEI